MGVDVPRTFWINRGSLINPNIWLRHPSHPSRERWLRGDGSPRWMFAINNETVAGVAGEPPVYGNGVWCDEIADGVMIRQDTIAFPNPDGLRSWCWTVLMASQWEGYDGPVMPCDGSVWLDAYFDSKCVGDYHSEVIVGVMAADYGDESGVAKTWSWEGLLDANIEFDEDLRAFYCWVSPPSSNPYPFMFAQVDLRVAGHAASGRQQIDLAAVTRRVVEDNPEVMGAPVNGWENVRIISVHVGLQTAGPAQAWVAMAEPQIYSGDPIPTAPPVEPPIVQEKSTRLVYPIASGRYYSTSVWPGRKGAVVSWPRRSVLVEREDPPGWRGMSIKHDTVAAVPGSVVPLRVDGALVIDGALAALVIDQGSGAALLPRVEEV